MTRKEKERRRMLAADDLRAGMTEADVARKYGVDPGTVNRWHKRLQKPGGKINLRGKPHPGRAPALDIAKRVALERILVEGAQAHGFESDLWTMPRLNAVVRRELGVEIDESSLRKTLVRMGYSWQRPERRARERNERAIRAWVRNDWPEIAKRGRSRGT